MSALKFKRFTRPQLLHAISRPLLSCFFEKFQPEFTARGIAPPGAGLGNDEWTAAAAALLCAPESLPDSACEALLAIDEMATPDGQDQLERAAAQAGLSLAGYGPGSASRQDIALQVWLADPALLARVRNRQRLMRLTAFEYFGATRIPGPQRKRPFQPPDPQTLAALAAALDPWFSRHHRGHNTSRVEMYPFQLDGGRTPESQPLADVEYWFLVRHGDTFKRASKVEEQSTGIIHFRPQRDDVVVYSPAREELRVNARTRGERELYVRTFGAFLCGAEDYFAGRSTYTLEPLRSLGPDVLRALEIPELSRVTLRRIEAIHEGTDEIIIREARDLFGSARESRAEWGVGEPDPIPRSGRLCCAHFDLHFAGCPRPRPLHIRLPNVLKLRRHCDLHVVEPLVDRFRVRSRSEEPLSPVSND